MKGTWNGYYTYNNQAAQEAIGHQMTYFKLKIKEINQELEEKGRKLIDKINALI